ncbi:hypothetical protein [Antarctobacter sp.]|uniref:hypothetical protein n=1 Tax=Antarctobacter sp. TaxID=1872577 RepID=UPI002B2768E8|nr:hypothetical protein [Antarctobacter sp.]
MELALRPGPHAPGLFHLLRAIAAPISQYMLDNRLSTKAFYAEMARAEAGHSPPDREHAEEHGGTARVRGACMAAVSAAVPQLIGLLNNAPPALVAPLLMLLAEVPERWSDSAPRIISTLDTSSDPAVQRAGVYALGRLSRSVETGDADAVLRAWLSPRHPLPVRAEAALGMTSSESARRDVLLQALQGADSLYGTDKADGQLRRSQAWTADRVAAQLARWRGTEAQRAETVTTIIAALPQARAADAVTAGLVRALLTALAAGAPIEGMFRGRRRSMLTDLDRHALQAIVAHGDWIANDTRNAAFASMMQRCGLPDTGPDLDKFATRPGVLARLLRR